MTYAREYFASHAHDVLVIRLTADKKQSISFEASLSRPEKRDNALEGVLIMEGNSTMDGMGTPECGMRPIWRSSTAGKLTGNEGR